VLSQAFGGDGGDASSSTPNAARDLVSLAAVESAADRIESVIRHTPIDSSKTIATS